MKLSLISEKHSGIYDFIFAFLNSSQLLINFGKNQFILDTTERLESAKAYDNFVRRATTSNGPIPVTWLSKREKKIWPKLAEFHSINDFYSPQELRT